MDLSWCPVCDKQNFAIESLYCSEACRKKDAISTLNEEYTYEFPRCSSQKPYQSPYNSPCSSPCTTPHTSPELSPIISPTNTMMDYGFQSINSMSSSPSELLFHGFNSSIMNRTNFFFNNTADSLKAKVSRKKKYF
uniref:Coiled-coil domain-containing protein 157 n=1 Tax=Anthurium amnicola TaxID=1678845 RepID=A0A1D1Y6W2_9ARAE